MSTGPYYTIRGFSTDGRLIVAMPIFAASAGVDALKADALLMLSDAGHDCATADVVELKKTNAALNPVNPAAAAATNEVQP